MTEIVLKDERFAADVQAIVEALKMKSESIDAIQHASHALIITEQGVTFGPVTAEYGYDYANYLVGGDIAVTYELRDNRHYSEPRLRTIYEVKYVFVRYQWS